MIYIDRVEVVNVLDVDYGKLHLHLVERGTLNL